MRLTTKKPIASEFRKGYVHPVGTDATFLEQRGVSEELNEPIWLVELHAPDESLVGGYSHDVAEVRCTDLVIEEDGQDKNQGVLDVARAWRTSYGYYSSGHAKACLDRGAGCMCGYDAWVTSGATHQEAEIALAKAIDAQATDAGDVGDVLQGEALVNLIASRLWRLPPMRRMTVATGVLIELWRRTRMTVEQLLTAVRDAWDRERSMHTAPPCAACENNECVSCGRRKNEDDDSKVTWKCSRCGHCVCRACTMTIPGRFPAEYYHQTFCGTECWRMAGEPRE